MHLKDLPLLWLVLAHETVSWLADEIENLTRAYEQRVYPDS